MFFPTKIIFLAVLSATEMVAHTPPPTPAPVALSVKSCKDTCAPVAPSYKNSKKSYKDSKDMAAPVAPSYKYSKKSYKYSKKNSYKGYYGVPTPVMPYSAPYSAPVAPSYKNSKKSYKDSKDMAAPVAPSYKNSKKSYKYSKKKSYKGYYDSCDYQNMTFYSNENYATVDSLCSSDSGDQVFSCNHLSARVVNCWPIRKRMLEPVNDGAQFGLVVTVSTPEKIRLKQMLYSYGTDERLDFTDSVSDLEFEPGIAKIQIDQDEADNQGERRNLFEVMGVNDGEGIVYITLDSVNKTFECGMEVEFLETNSGDECYNGCAYATQQCFSTR